MTGKADVLGDRDCRGDTVGLGRGDGRGECDFRGVEFLDDRDEFDLDDALRLRDFDFDRLCDFEWLRCAWFDLGVPGDRLLRAGAERNLV